MGQKVHPYGFRLGVIKTWNSKWFEDKSYAKWLHEDIRIKRAVKDYLMNANIASIEVERAANKAKVIVFTARPGMVIGKGGKGIETLKTGNLKTAAKGETLFPGVQSFTENEVFIDVQEIRKAETASFPMMQQFGLTIQHPDPKALAEWRQLAEGLWPKLRGTMVPADLFDEVKRLRDDYRKAHPADAPAAP